MQSMAVAGCVQHAANSSQYLAMSIASTFLTDRQAKLFTWLFRQSTRSFTSASCVS
ncbi:hypothetical protein [Acidovorax sp. T1m]|uniref:hypothetical protein n=1 Tax=Acidovorax sp. T1m TaxID=2006116 RepID=UPI0013031E21|nr:hypothetical protein [Acidovorax sp. T1m]